MSQNAMEKQMEVEVDRVTIHRILNCFCEDGVIHMVVAEDGKQYLAIFANWEDKNKLPADYFHFRCTNCQTLECLPALVCYLIPEHYTVERFNCVLIRV